MEAAADFRMIRAGGAPLEEGARGGPQPRRVVGRCRGRRVGVAAPPPDELGTAMEAPSDLCFVEALVGETKHPPFHRSKRCSVDHEMCSLPWTRTGSLHNLLPRLGLASRLAPPPTSTQNRQARTVIGHSPAKFTSCLRERGGECTRPSYPPRRRS